MIVEDKILKLSRGQSSFSKSGVCRTQERAKYVLEDSPVANKN